MRLTTYFCVAASALFAGCSLAPRYRVPDTGTPPAAFHEGDGWKLAEPADDQSRGGWWHIYRDGQLDALEGRVALGNQSLRAGLARLEQARAATRIATGGYFPTVDANGRVTRTKVSINGPDYSPTRPSLSNDLYAGASLSYELDLFGRIRNTARAARANEQASAGDVATLELATRAELASDYFQLRGLDAQLSLLDHTVDDYAKALTLTENLYKGGAAALADVQQATAQLEAARTQAADVRLRRSQLEHAIAVLVGERPTDFRVDAAPLPDDAEPPAVDSGLPSRLLERRPDVAAAERRVAAANAEIGVARAAYFPDFSIGILGGYESLQRSSWFSAPSRTWAAGPQGVLTLFDAGVHRAQSAAAHAAFDEQVANYRQTALVAFQEVEDNLAALSQLKRESASVLLTVRATHGALEQANYRYHGGIVTYLEVVSAENAALAAQLSAVDIATRRLVASVGLIRALGGDWMVPERQ